MATQRRSWLARVGVILAVMFGALIGLTTPAQAATDAVLVGSNFEPSSVNVGQSSTLKVTIKNGGNVDNKTFNVNITSENGGVATVSGASNKQITLNKGAQGNLEFTLRGQGTGGQQQAQVKVIIKEGSDTLGDETLTVKAPVQEAQTVGRLSGEVKNIIDGKGVGGATVTVRDPAGKAFSAKTSTAGAYVFDGRALKITPGTLEFSVTKDPLVMADGAAKTIQVGPNQDMALPPLNMTNPTAATPTAGAPTEAPASTDPLASGSAANPVTENKADEGGLDGMTLLMIIVGGVLVALGIGAIVLLIVRRNNDEEEDEDDEQLARGRPGGPRGPQQPGYRQPPPPGYGQPAGAGYGRGADPTMVARPGMNDAPTMMHRPDPYGAQPTQQYGQQPGHGQPGYGQPSSGGGYGAQASGGGAYGSPQAAPQASGGGAYGSPQPPWSGGGAYGAQQQQPGYGQQYDEPTSYAGGAGGGTDGGYDQGYQQQPGYPQQQGYAPQDGYGQTEQYGQQGYQQDPYGGQGYSDDRRNRGDRRLDWLDD